MGHPDMCWFGFEFVPAMLRQCVSAVQRMAAEVSRPEAVIDVLCETWFRRPVRHTREAFVTRRRTNQRAQIA